MRSLQYFYHVKVKIFRGPPAVCGFRLCGWNYLFHAFLLKTFMLPNKCTHDQHIRIVFRYSYMFRHGCAILKEFIH